VLASIARLRFADKGIPNPSIEEQNPGVVLCTAQVDATLKHQSAPLYRCDSNSGQPARLSVGLAGTQTPISFGLPEKGVQIRR
jgi:hypothetical protein